MNTYETWVMMNSENDVISEEHETSYEVITEMLEKYTIEEMHDNVFTLNKLLCDENTWIECIEEIDY